MLFHKRANGQLVFRTAVNCPEIHCIHSQFVPELAQKPSLPSQGFCLSPPVLVMPFLQLPQPPGGQGSVQLILTKEARPQRSITA